MLEIYYKIGFAVLWIVYISIRVPHDRIYKQKQIVIKKNILNEKLIIGVNFIGFISLPCIWLFFHFLSSFDINLSNLSRLLGLIIMAFSLWFFRWVHKSLGENWSPLLEITNNHKLITNGPYKYIRHPMYFQMFLWAIAQILVVSNWIAGFSGLVAWIILYLVRVPAEEKMLIEKFGNTYKEYQLRTGSFLPKLF
jgi:protein-S-isoprenylcysteine O-methyltransferase Ste14